MDESILTSIKKLLGLTEDYTAFDDQLIMTMVRAREVVEPKELVKD